MNQILTRLAQWMYRRPSDAEKSRTDYSILGVYIVFLLTITLALLWGLYRETYIWQASKATFPIERSQWTAIIDDEANCSRDEAASCVVSPRSQKLWSADQLQGTIEDRLKDGKISRLWLGLKISPETADDIRRTRSNHYLLGWIKGEYWVWVNGRLIKHVEKFNRTPASIEIPEDLLHKEHEIFMAIYVEPRKNAVNVVPFTARLGEGFTNGHSQYGFERFFEFVEKTKAASLFFVYLVFSLVFFGVWGISRLHSEYLYLAIFALLMSTPELIYSDFLTMRVSETFAFPIYFLWLFAKCAVGLGIGLSYSRSNRRLTKTLVFSIFSIGVVLVSFADSTTLFSLRKPMTQFILPLGFSLGALSCLLQAYSLNNERKTFLRRRITHLVGFSLALFCLSSLSFIRFSSANYISQELLWGIPELIIFSYLGYLALQTLRYQNQLAEKTPMSPYHKMRDLPDWIEGGLLMIDLKNSEILFQKSVENECPYLVPTVISHIWNSVDQHGGTVFKAEGDEIIAFFDAKKIEDPIAAALAACDAATESVKRARTQFDGNLPELHFRGSISFGKIQPAWNGQGKDKLPIWNQVGDTMVFVEAARLLEIEKQVESPHKTQIVMTSETFKSQKFGKINGQFIHQDKTYLAKHDAAYEIVVYAPVSGKRLQLAA